jgi:hypothetical protein
VDANTELEIVRELERQLAALSLRAPSLCELPFAPLRGVDDLVRLELALPRFAEIHRSKRSKLLIGAVRILLQGARARLREMAPVNRVALRTHQVPFRDTQPAA